MRCKCTISSVHKETQADDKQTAQNWMMEIHGGEWAFISAI